MEFTEDEQMAIKKMQMLFQKDLPEEKLKDRIFFYKFLKSRDFNIAKAESMLRKSLRWRKELQIETIIDDFVPSKVLKEYVSQNIIGFDKEGCVIKYNAVGSMDTIGLYKSSNSLNIFKCVIQNIENDIRMLKEQSKKLGRPVNQILVIYDMKGMTLAKASHNRSIQGFRDGMSLFQDNYPEHLKCFYVINASVYYTLAFQIIKAVLASAVISKVKVYGKDGWKEALLKDIDADVLPAFLGGNRTDPDGNPNCNSFIHHVGPIPESYHIIKDFEKFGSKKDAKFLRIERRDKVQIAVDVQEQVLLHWEFLVKDYDIGFGLNLENPETKTASELIPVHKIETEREPENGFYRCKKAGMYYLIFDNEYSWIYGKELFYRTWISHSTLKQQSDVKLKTTEETEMRIPT